MKHLFLTLMLSLLFKQLPAQQARRHDILDPVRLVFRAMAAGDSALLGQAFHPEVRLATVSVDSAGRPRVHREESLKPFQQAIARAGAGVLYEPIRNIRIRRRGSYAEVWAEYDFYLRGRFHHCGIDSFQLIRTSAGWKIVQLTDTRETTGCRPSRRQRPRS